MMDKALVIPVRRYGRWEGFLHSRGWFRGFLLIILFVLPAFSQPTIQKAVLKGVIMDFEGKAVASARVTVDSISTVTGQPGDFRLEIIVSDTGGTYRVKVEADGYRSKSVLVRLISRDTTVQNIMLVPVVLRRILPVRFKPKSVTIQKSGYMDVVSRLLKNNPELKVEIRSHCFEWESKKRNLRSSQARAEVVRQLLITKWGIDSSRIVAKGWGSSCSIGDKVALPRRYQTRMEINLLP